MAFLSLVLCFSYFLITVTRIVEASESPAVKYVLVGAGTTGLLLANRLSSDPNNAVTIIDPGPDDRTNPNVTNPLIWLRNMNSSVDWAYVSAPQAGANNRTLQYHAGKIVGGSSMINGMTYLWPDKAEIDAWQALGAEGWNWEALWPYYKRVEQFVSPTEAQSEASAKYVSKFHGENGELSVGYLFGILNGSFYGKVATTWNSLVYPTTADPSGGNLTGFDAWPMTVDRDANVRDSAARAFYYPVDKRPNVKILKGTVTKVLWGQLHGKKQVASGVEYQDEQGKSQSIDVGAQGEVILSAGSLRTPPILEASGIGHPTRLKKLGIAVRAKLPGVGENLQDQQNIALAYNGTLNLTGYAPYATFGTAQQVYGDEIRSIEKYVSSKPIYLRPSIGALTNLNTWEWWTKGNLSTWAQKIASTSNGVSANAVKQIFHIQHDLIFKKNVSVAEILTTSSSTRLLSAFWTSLPFARGSVYLRSTANKDIDNPVIDPQFFQIDFDLQSAVRVGQIAQTFWANEPVKDLVQDAVVGPMDSAKQVLAGNATESQWSSFIRASAGPNYHPLGTGAMMARALGGVTSPQLKVYGTTNLRVVDASAIPLQNSGHLMSTLYALVERAADMILGKWYKS